MTLEINWYTNTQIQKKTFLWMFYCFLLHIPWKYALLLSAKYLTFITFFLNIVFHLKSRGTDLFFRKKKKRKMQKFLFLSSNLL